MKSISAAELLVTSFVNSVIIDVRSDDFVGGNIPGAVNIPSSQYEEGIKLYAESYSTVIVHCLYSQVRGPTIAKKLAYDYPDKEVIILRGGFTDYLNFALSSSPQKIANLDMSYWHFQDGKYEYKYD